MLRVVWMAQGLEPGKIDLSLPQMGRDVDGMGSGGLGES